METSTSQIDVALFDGPRLIGKKSSAENQKTAAVITPLIAQVLAESSLSPQQIDAVALSIGPGSFTGLRIGCVTAKVWSFALDRPIIAVQTHEAIATQACHFGAGPAKKIWVCTDAHRQQLFVSSWNFNATESEFASLDPVNVCDPKEFIEQINAEDLITGEGLKKLPAALAAELLATRTPADVWRAKASVIGEIALRKFAIGEFADPMTLKPLYIRPSAAEEKARLG
ncbi:MAG: tRNA (adenosine(37)-N6)-threonylcarbamoyltransferase complex dimerization subunit type 1 TsaB [Pirellulaceae bacterium]